MSDPAASVVPSSQVTRSTADENGDEPTVIQVSSGAASLLAALPPLQRNVLLRLANGASIAQAACGCNVCRMTVYRWIKKPGPFQAAYDRWRQELVESSQTRLLQLLDEAVDAVQSAILDGKVDVALELLKTMGAMKKPKLGRGALTTCKTREAP